MREPLVLLPGMNCSPRLWSGVQRALHAEDVAVVLAELSAEDLDSCVDALLADLPPRFALCGLSLGGIVAMTLTRRAPQRVTRLCLASTNAREPTEEQRAAWAEQLAELDRGVTARELQRRLLPVLVVPELQDSLQETVLQMGTEVGERRLAGQLRIQATRVDERPGLSSVEVPTLVLAAERDALCPVERHEEIHALVADSELVALPGAGHLSPLEQPAAVTRELRRWWGRAD